jgi:deoxyhypusine synthase
VVDNDDQRMQTNEELLEQMIDRMDPELQDRLLTNQTRPFEPKQSSSIADVLDRMRLIGFQGRSLGEVFRIWCEMLQDEVTVFLGISGALVPAGMREVFRTLIEHRFVDVIVTTGANLFHDMCECHGFPNYLGTPRVDDVKLRRAAIDRMYDIYASDLDFLRVDKWVADTAVKMDRSRAYTTREFIYHLGEALGPRRAWGIVNSAAVHGVPVYCPALGDSSIGIALADTFNPRGESFLFDILRDVSETADIVLKSKGTGIILLGGGTPKNFIQQAEVTAILLYTQDVPGHRYAVQVTTDAPHWGGLSGCTFEESQSWGKIDPNARRRACYCDATIALPLLATGLVERFGEKGREYRPRFDISGSKLGIEA